MLEYLHFVPGRLRLKISELRHQRRAAEAEAYVSAIPAVRSTVANPTTGSLTINFDHHELSTRDLWQRLWEQGYVASRYPEPTTIGSASMDNPGGDRLGRVVMTAVVEAIVQHSAQALVRALL
jgi:hypothetical protein